MRALKQVFIFKDVSDPVLRIVAKAAEELTIPAGETIVSAAHALNALYVIRNGTVRAVADGEGAPPGRRSERFSSSTAGHSVGR
jgi:CRP-like cAMP-binding protein